MSSNASVRSFQSDLERINEDYNKTYAYAGQTSASAMRPAAPASARGRRAESVISSAMSDTSEAPAPDSAARRKLSRVSFSDVDENETRSRNPSPNPEKKRSAMKQPAPPMSSLNDSLGRGGVPSQLMPPPSLARRVSNSSLRSDTSVNKLANTPILAAPLSRTVQPSRTIQEPTDAKVEDGDLSTIASNSAYSDADEDYKASPAIKRASVTSPDTRVDSKPEPLLLTQQNLAAASGTAQEPLPMKSAMKKTPSQNGSARFSRLETDSQLDVADDESDDSFAARRRAKKIAGKRSLTTLRGTDSPKSSSPRTVSVARPASNIVSQAQDRPRGVQRSNSVTSHQSRASQGPSRMVSLRASPAQPKRMSMQNGRSASAENVPALQRRTSMQSLSSMQPPLPPKSTRRSSVAGSVAESVRSEAVTNHIAVMELAQQRVQRMLHPDAANGINSNSTFADAPERRKTSFERKRPTGLSRQNSSSSMIDRSFRTSLRPEPSEPPKHKRAMSDQRAFASTMRGDRARPTTQRSSSMVFSSAHDVQSMPATPSKGRRMSFSFGRKKEANESMPPVPAMRRYSSDSDSGSVSRKEGVSALSAGTLRDGPGDSARPTANRMRSDVSYSKRTGKPKKFQALRRLFKIKD